MRLKTVIDAAAGEFACRCAFSGIALGREGLEATNRGAGCLRFPFAVLARWIVCTPAGCCGSLRVWESSGVVEPHEQSLTMLDNGVFISYRRGTGSEVARKITEFLEGQGFDVFLDVDCLGAGHFDEQILREIESRRNFLLICSPGCLDRCVNEGDWVRRELEYAIRTGRHIVPVTMPQFVWPTLDAVPRVVKELQRHNAFEYSHSHWALTKQKLASMLGRPSRSKRRASATEPGEQSVMRRYGVWVAAGAVSVLAMLLWASLGGNSDRQSGTRSEWPEDLAGGGAGEKAVVQAPAAQEAAVRRGWNGDWDVEVLREEPDPAVVTDAAARARMIATKLPWKVRDKKTGIVMLLCPPGEFMMGSPASESGRETDETHHRRTIGTAFYLGETEVTQEQWQRVMAENPSYFKGASSPVEQVSWDDCKRFCASTRFRLPTSPRSRPLLPTSSRRSRRAMPKP